MTQSQQYFSSLGFGVLFFAFLAYAFFNVKALDSAKFLILRIMTAVFGAITAGLFTGAATVKYDQQIPGGHLAVSGVAGFAIFIFVWLKFPAPPPLDSGPASVKVVHFHVPDGWTVRQATSALGEQVGAIVQYEGFTKEELLAPLRDYEIHAKSTLEAIRQVRNITQIPAAVRDYDVGTIDSTILLKVKV